MSNDLISRSAVIDVIKRHECNTIRIMEGVMELPAAYNVDKVVEQLEENAKYFQCEADGLAQVGNWGTATELQGKAAAYRDAAKTVKSGGIE